MQIGIKICFFFDNAVAIKKERKRNRKGYNKIEKLKKKGLKTKLEIRLFRSFVEFFQNSIRLWATMGSNCSSIRFSTWIPR